MIQRHGMGRTAFEELTQGSIDRLWRDRGTAAHLLPGDFHPRNLLVRHGRVVPIDFHLERRRTVDRIERLRARPGAGACVVSAGG